MRAPTKIALLVALAAAVAPRAARAGAAGLKHERSIYFDDQEGPLRSPEGVACAENGRFVVADTGNGRLLTFSWQDGTLRGGQQIKLAQVPYPVRVQLDAAGNVLVLDRRLKKIARLTVSGDFGGYVEPRNAGPTPVIPGSFRVADGGDLVVLDVAGRRVLFLDPGGQVKREVPVPKEASFADVAFGPGGKLYAIDPVRASLWAVAKDGSAFDRVGPPLKDRMSFPTYLSSDQRGRLLVVDQNGMGIVVLGADGSFQGRELAIGWTDGLLYYPAQMCTTAAGDAFVADRNNDRVQVFSMAR